MASAILPLLRGTTSACAENTALLENNGASCGNYLRVRGEYAPCGA